MGMPQNVPVFGEERDAVHATWQTARLTQKNVFCQSLDFCNV